ncbi:MAG: prolipoprotein diacylglyceryl transferase, partial [Candidatus Ancillula sp.]|nr:prolipoprotein diacylglyceryl transferase [Candidatus Ancillula sp.]
MNLYTHIPTPPASSFQIGEFNIHYYGLFIMVGFILAATWSYFRAKKIDLKIADNVLNILIVLLPSAIVGARLYY